jgi:hypothetical protein
MTTNILEGTAFAVTPRGISLFGVKGFFHGPHWVISMPVDGSEVPFEMASCPVAGSIESVLNGDIAAGNAQWVSYILIQPRIGVRLFLEGVLTFEHFQHAQEGAGFITLPGVPFLGRSWTVMIGSEDVVKYAISTRDVTGDLV